MSFNEPGPFDRAFRETGLKRQARFDRGSPRRPPSARTRLAELARTGPIGERVRDLGVEVNEIAIRLGRMPRKTRLVVRAGENLDDQVDRIAGPGGGRLPTRSGLRQVRRALGVAATDAHDAGLEDVSQEIAARQFEVEEILEEL